MSRWENNGKLSKKWNVIKLGKKDKWYTLQYGTIPIENFTYDKSKYDPINVRFQYLSNLTLLEQDINEKTGKYLRLPVICEIITMIERVSNK